MDDPNAFLDEGPLAETEEEAQEETKKEELPKMKKPLEEMTPEEVRARLVLERTHTIKTKTKVTETQINEWKTAYGRIATMLFEEKVYFFRPLRRGEHRKIMKRALSHSEDWRRELDMAEEVALVCTLEPLLDRVHLRNEMAAGIADELSEAIQRISGYGAAMSLVEL